MSNINFLMRQWYVWLFMTIIIIATYAYVTAQVYAWHPMEIRIYANDEMVVTSGNIIKIQRDQAFNECLDNCIPDTTLIDNCASYCFDYYGDQVKHVEG